MPAARGCEDIWKRARVEREGDMSPNETSSDREDPKQRTERLCSCLQDPFADIPPAERPKTPPKPDGMRQVTCPGCGLVYSTNRKTDWCFACEKLSP